MMVPMRYADDFRTPGVRLLVMLGHLLWWRSHPDSAYACPEQLPYLEAHLGHLLFPAAWSLRVGGWTRSVHRSWSAAEGARQRLTNSRRYRWGSDQPVVEVAALETETDANAARREARIVRGTTLGLGGAK